VAFTNVLTMYQIYHPWIHLLHHSPSSPTPNYWSSFNRYHFCIYIHVDTFFALYFKLYYLLVPVFWVLYVFWILVPWVNSMEIFSPLCRLSLTSVNFAPSVIPSAYVYFYRKWLCLKSHCLHWCLEIFL
jgi:hypothetical protein